MINNAVYSVMTVGVFVLAPTRPTAAQRLSTSPSFTIPTDYFVRIDLRPGAMVSPAVRAQAPHGTLFHRIVGVRADSLLIEITARGADSAWVPIDSLAVPATAVATLDVRSFSGKRARIDSGMEGGFYGGLLGVIVGAIFKSAGRGAAIGAAAGGAWGALLPDQDAGYRWDRITLHVEPSASDGPAGRVRPPE
jgi:hypothetical protein